MRWVSWCKIVTPKFMGGLGLGEIRSLNWAFLAKWKWRIKSCSTQLWACVISVIHGSQNNVDNIPLKKDIRGVWKDILASTKDMEKAGITESDRWGIVTGDDSSSMFSVTLFREEVMKKIGTKVNVAPFRWNAWAPIKINLFVWRSVVGWIATKAALADRGVNVRGTTCSLCGCERESVQHLMATCIMSKAIWWHIFSWVKIPFPLNAQSCQDLMGIIQ
ncbi:putative reverse transcriptase zinc-binding domain-containing protein [Helianthus annuus]|nr:putative reverse transcriptase zinc-binding domain-containing protein [Helianthus annuus]KAJ0609771.1 putative reverse transcriptase zinc-binding domain-containing protein [Helianthus annuus]KAJ0937753.1 putative reverse transcriptase zinc-binding domain-containing protein [Helianthus annuus]